MLILSNHGCSPLETSSIQFSYDNNIAINSAVKTLLLSSLFEYFTTSTNNENIFPQKKEERNRFKTMPLK